MTFESKMIDSNAEKSLESVCNINYSSISKKLY